MKITTVSLPNGYARSRKAADPPKKNGMYRPKEKVSVTSSGGYRQRADNLNPSTDPTTEKDSFNTENNTAGQFPCLAGLHITGGKEKAAPFNLYENLSEPIDNYSLYAYNIINNLVKC